MQANLQDQFVELPTNEKFHLVNEAIVPCTYGTETEREKATLPMPFGINFRPQTTEVVSAK